VRPDGKISLPLLHDLQASGLTALQLRDKLAVAMAEFMPNPEVSVIVNEVRSFRVSLLGRSRNRVCSSSRARRGVRHGGWAA